MKYSVIIPVYNVSKYIRDCLVTITEQTYHDYEIIIVDDGSTDHSIDIVHEFDHFPNLIIYRQANTGLAGARASGLLIATGEYVLFLDSDDYVDRNLLKTVDSYIESKTDLLEFASISFYDGVDIRNHTIRDTITTEYDRKEFLQKIVYEDIILGSRACVVWNKVYRRRLIEEYVSEQNALMPLEDFVFNAQFYCGVNHYRGINIPLYYYRDRPGSITKKVRKDIQTVLNEVNRIQIESLRYMGLYTNETEAKIQTWYLRYLFYAMKNGYLSGTFTRRDIKDIISSSKVREYCASLAKKDNSVITWFMRKQSDRLLIMSFRCQNVALKTKLNIKKTLGCYR